MINIAVLGHGVVGSGVVEVVSKNKESIAKKVGDQIAVKKILDIRDFDDLPYKDIFTKNFDDILNDDEISVIAEVMGGVEPAFSFVSAALSKGKSVVTSNKELVAQKGAQLLKIAKDNNVNFFFEASVGGGIPVIRPLHQCLAANQIEEIAGILNGTTNFILGKMIKENMSFDDALKLAQDLGYAERNPSADVDGHDACRKICILASLAFGKHIYPDNVNTVGITKITLDDVEFANSCNGTIKLIGRAKKLDNGTVSICVSPAILNNESQLAGINDVFNGVLVKGDATGDVMFYGKGAGKLPTASAVVADVIDAAKSNSTSKSQAWADTNENIVAPFDDMENRFYLRVESSDSSKACEEIKQIFGDVVFLENKNAPANQIAFVSSCMKNSQLNQKLESLASHSISPLSKIDVLDY